MEVDVERLQSHVARLSRLPRPAGSPELEQARIYVSECIDAAGWSVERVTFQAETEKGTRLGGTNLIARHREHPPAGRPCFCVGAHLDSLPDTPGADDNASAVATMLEIARLLPGDWPDDPQLDLELVVFDLEENGMLGGAAHVQRMKADAVDLRGMVSLEMLGYCDHRPNSQALPRALEGMYPETANFIAIIGNQNSHELIEQFRTGMQRVRELPVETLAVPSNGEFLQATRLSDHSPFWDAGYPALMITDTSFLRNPHYHLPSDTLETLDMQFLHRVAEGCLSAVRHVVAVGLSTNKT
jgi:Zn-dependent M28 family amino/carboxypeptidase